MASERLIQRMADKLLLLVGDGESPSILTGRGRREIAEICAKVAVEEAQSTAPSEAGAGEKSKGCVLCANGLPRRGPFHHLPHPNGSDLCVYCPVTDSPPSQEKDHIHSEPYCSVCGVDAWVRTEKGWSHPCDPLDRAPSYRALIGALRATFCGPGYFDKLADALQRAAESKAKGGAG